MTLINIEYGSMASSTTMNTNFSYLDNRISQTAEVINTDISSILSNIATINSRIGDLSDEITESIEDCGADLEESDLKTLNCINNLSMLPRWTGLITVSTPKSYTAPSNGYLMLLTANQAAGNVSINNASIQIKQRANVYDNCSNLITLPVKKGDVYLTTIDIQKLYFVPISEGEFENA